MCESINNGLISYCWFRCVFLECPQIWMFLSKTEIPFLWVLQWVNLCRTEYRYQTQFSPNVFDIATVDILSKTWCLLSNSFTHSVAIGSMTWWELVGSKPATQLHWWPHCRIGHCMLSGSIKVYECSTLYNWIHKYMCAHLTLDFCKFA